MGFKENYTTKNKKEKNPTSEEGKEEISVDAFAQGEMLELLINTLRNK